MATATGRIKGELYKNVTGLKAVEVATDGPTASTRCRAARSISACTIRCSLGAAARGPLRILAVSTAPAGRRAGPTCQIGRRDPMDCVSWFAALWPRTPRPVIDTIHAWFVQMVSTEETKKFLNSFGGDPYINTPEQGQR